VGCGASRFIALVLVEAGSAGTRDPFVEIVAYFRSVWALGLLEPGGKGAGIGEMV